MLIVDTHVHIYPHYDQARLLETALRNLGALRQAETEARLGIALVEREGCDVFGAWAAGVGLPRGAHAERLDATALELTFEQGDKLLVFAGRQVACRERVEILGMLCDAQIADGVSVAEAIEAIIEAEGIPALAWGAGKWMFKRKSVVERLMRDNSAERLLIGDTAMRPVGWSESRIMRRERLVGRRVLAGSDPMPSGAGQEMFVGSYATRIESERKAEESVSNWLRRALFDPSASIERVGRRRGLAQFIRSHF
jgi:hypothetical protein